MIRAVCQVYKTGDKLIKLEILARLIAKDAILLIKLLEYGVTYGYVTVCGCP